MTISRKQVLELQLVAGLCLGLVYAGGAAAETKAFVGARIFDGSGKPVIDNGTIVVQDGKITAIGPRIR